MKTKMKRVTADEKGAALILTLVLLLVASLIIPSLLGFMYGGLRQGEVYERRGGELYAADAAVEEALWRVQTGNVTVPSSTCEQRVWPYYIPSVNSNPVTYVITYLDDVGFFVESETMGEHSQTRIEAYIVDMWGDYSAISDHILCSTGLVSPHKFVELEFDPDENYPYPNYPEDLWPPEQLIYDFYWADVKDGEHRGDTNIGVTGESLERGPLFVNGEFTVRNADNKNSSRLTLTGTLFSVLDTKFGKGSQSYDGLIVDLKGHTIFVDGRDAHSNYALEITDSCTILGPGVIVALGDIYFAPKGDVGSPDAPVFIISVGGTTTIRPSGKFYGAIAGSVEVEVQLGKDPSITYPPDGFPEDLNFPGFLHDKQDWSLFSWRLDEP